MGNIHFHNRYIEKASNTGLSGILKPGEGVFDNICNVFSQDLYHTILHCYNQLLNLQKSVLMVSLSKSVHLKRQVDFLTYTSAL